MLKSVAQTTPRIRESENPRIHIFELMQIVFSCARALGKILCQWECFPPPTESPVPFHRLSSSLLHSMPSSVTSTNMSCMETATAGEVLHPRVHYIQPWGRTQFQWVGRLPSDTLFQSQKEIFSWKFSHQFWDSTRLDNSSSWSMLSLLVVQIQLALQVWGIGFPATTKPSTYMISFQRFFHHGNISGLGKEPLTSRDPNSLAPRGKLRPVLAMLCADVSGDGGVYWNPANFEIHIAPNDPNVPSHIAIRCIWASIGSTYSLCLCVLCIVYRYNVQLHIVLVWGRTVYPPGHQYR